MKAREVIATALDDYDECPDSDDVITALELAGYAIVPVEPSEKMIEAYDKVAVEENGAHASLNNTAYTAMLQAAKEEG